MEAVFPAAPPHRHRTTPVTFAEIKEVDEEQGVDAEQGQEVGGERRRRPDELVELSREFAEFRRRRATRRQLREPDDGDTDAHAHADNAPNDAASATARKAPAASKSNPELTRARSEPTA